MENNLKRNIGLAVAAVLATVVLVAVLLSVKSKPRQFEESDGSRMTTTDTTEADSGESTVPSWFGHEEFSDLEDVPDDTDADASQNPTVPHTNAPTNSHTNAPTVPPTHAPTAPPTHAPTEAPTASETHTEQLPAE